MDARSSASRTAQGHLRRIRDVRVWSANPLSSRRNGALPRTVGQCQGTLMSLVKR
jgi:hypothetical protein